MLFLLALSLTGTGAFLTSNNLLFLIFSAMLALLVVSGFLGRLMLSGLQLELLLPRHVAARAATDACVRLRNVKRLTPSFSIGLSGRRDPLTGLPPILNQPVYFPVLPGHKALEAQVKVTFPQRGRHRENLFVLTTRFPFGFLRREATIPITRDTLVYPAIESTRRAEELLEGVAGQLETQQRGRGQDFYRIRPWESSDGVRLVDWKSTAHTGELQAREFAREEQPAVEIVFDRLIHKGSDAAFEALVEDCAWLVWTLADRGISFDLVCEGRTVATSGDDDPYAALRFLATIQPVVTNQPGQSLAEGANPVHPGSEHPRILLSVLNPAE